MVKIFLHTKCRLNTFLLPLSMILMLGVILTLSSACEPIAPLKVLNQTAQTLSIYVRWQDDVFYMGDVAPGEELQNTNAQILEFSSFPIEARDAQGNLVYSRRFTMVELTEELHYRIVIPPLQNK